MKIANRRQNITVNPWMHIILDRCPRVLGTLPIVDRPRHSSNIPLVEIGEDEEEEEEKVYVSLRLIAFTHD